MGKKHKNRLIYKTNGDITKVSEIEYYIKFFQNNKRNIVTSDCGLGRSVEETYDREKKMSLFRMKVTNG